MTEGIEGMDALKRRIAAVGADAPALILRSWQSRTVELAKDNAASFSRTRVLQRSILPGDLDLVGKSASVTAGGTQTHGYARYVEEGTRPHEIRPRKKKALFFASQGALTARAGAGAIIRYRQTGNVNAATQRKYGNLAYVHAMVVHHPGTRPQPYLRPAAERAAEELDIRTTVVVAWNGAA